MNSSNNTNHCDECNITFKSLPGLKVHMKRIHNTQSDAIILYKCVYCDKQFADKSNLNKHIKICNVKQIKEKEELHTLQIEVIKLKAKEEILEAKYEAKEAKLESKAKDEILESKDREVKLITETKEEILELQKGLCNDLKQQLKKATRPIYQTTNNTQNNVIINVLEPITSEKIFKDIQNYSYETALSKKFPRTHGDVMITLHKKNPRSFISTDKSRHMLTWVDGDQKELKIINDKKGIELSKKVNHAIKHLKNEDPFEPLLQAIEDKRPTVTCEEEGMQITYAEDVIRKFKYGDDSFYNNLFVGSNNLIDIVPKELTETPTFDDTKLKNIARELLNIRFNPYKILCQPPQVVAQWIKYCLDCKIL